MYLFNFLTGKCLNSQYSLCCLESDSFDLPFTLWTFVIISNVIEVSRALELTVFIHAINVRLSAKRKVFRRLASVVTTSRHSTFSSEKPVWKGEFLGTNWKHRPSFQRKSWSVKHPQSLRKTSAELLRNRSSVYDRGCQSSESIFFLF